MKNQMKTKDQKQEMKINENKKLQKKKYEKQKRSQ